MNKTIFYFSATGNSLQTALDIADALGNTDVVSISKVGINYNCNSEVIGFVFPVYAWGLPNMVYDFITSSNFNKNAYFFSVVTCGGAIGTCLTDVDNILKEKGAYLHYGSKLPILSNYIFMVDINSDKVGKLLAKAEDKLDVIIQDIKIRKECRIKGSLGLLRKMHNKASANFKSTDKDYSVSKSCTKCGICVSVCPAKNIEIIDEKVTFKHNCEKCLACIHWCPQKAINYKNKTQNKQRYHNPKVKLSQLT
ncbi:EFR1 family ferrodoxin [Clostridium sp.]|uniref:EFR1 family ferrodoxin n=1 Tax=Clostridium sp. TaxID=1506 RepID=UPI0026351BB8|nr:EFR1 family ferrodoxin [Clostridium sp.]